MLLCLTSTSSKVCWNLMQCRTRLCPPICRRGTSCTFQAGTAYHNEAYCKDSRIRSRTHQERMPIPPLVIIDVVHAPFTMYHNKWSAQHAAWTTFRSMFERHRRLPLWLHPDQYCLMLSCRAALQVWTAHRPCGRPESGPKVTASIDEG